MRRTKSTVYSVRYWYRCIGSEGFHTSIIYGAAGLIYGRYRGLGDILRNCSPVRPRDANTKKQGDSPMSTCQPQRSSRPSFGVELS